MPPKKNAFVFSINPALYARSKAPAATVAMGMKSSHASSLNWVDQVRREEKIRERWGDTYDPRHGQEGRAVQAVDNTRAREVARHEAYTNPEHNPELHQILYRKAPPASTTATDSTAAGAATAAATSSGPTPDGIATEPMFGKDAARNFAAAHAARNATLDYLQARNRHRTVQERYPAGPATTSQAVGWAAGDTAHTSAAAIAATTAAFRQTRCRPVGAYRKPEDDEHALLLGFDYTPK